MKFLIYALLIISFNQAVKVYAKQSRGSEKKAHINAYCFESIDCNELKQNKNNRKNVHKVLITIGVIAGVVVGILYFHGNFFSTGTDLNENMTYRVPEGESVIEHLMNLPSRPSCIGSSAWFRSASNRNII